jgi:hypothetical protein
MRIKRFESFSGERTLYAFDFDDTLAETPSFEDHAIAFLKENAEIESMLKKAAGKLGIGMDSFKWQDGRIYIEDPSAKIEVKPNDKDWARKGPRIYLLQPEEFCLSDLSIPEIATQLKELYNSTEEKCIITARPERIRIKIEECLERLGLEYPKYGLHMYPSLNHHKAGRWKGQKMCEIAKQFGFDKVVFYDDNRKYIKAATAAVKELMPDLEFKAIKV